MKKMDSIRDYLRRNNFYAYLSETENISNNYLQEYRAVADPSNKRNLYLNKTWEDIRSFGDPRKVIIVDLGGTNLNLFDIEVTDEKTIKVNNTVTTGFYQDKVYTPEILYADLKQELDKFIIASEKRTSLENLVFIFAYPIEQLVREDGHIDAVCTQFIKEHRSEGIVGTQIGLTFQKFLRERGYPNVNVSVTNDTPIHCFSAKAYEIVHNEQFDAAMNIIVGTGCNAAAAYNEQNTPEAQGLRVINTEFGDFRGAPLSRFDEAFDQISYTKGVHLNEKMISGAYQHQIFKIIMRELIEEKLVPHDILNGWDLETMDSGAIEHKLRKNLPEHETIAYIWREINKRGGALCGIFLATIMTELSHHLKKEKLEIIIMETGSVIRKNEGFRESLLDTLDLQLGKMGHKDNIHYTFKHLDHQAAYGSVIFDIFSSPEA